MKWIMTVAAVTLAAFWLNPRPFGDFQRMTTWKIAAKVAAAHPVLGVGPDGFEKAFNARKPKEYGNEHAANAHNDILQVAATLGIVGLIAYALLSLDVFGSISGKAMGAMAALFVSAKFNPVPLEAMVLAGVICGAFPAKYYKAEPRPLPSPWRWAALGFAVIAVSVTLPLAKADYYARKWDLISLSKACTLNPGEQTYKDMMIRRGIMEINYTQAPEVVRVISLMLSKYANAKVTL